MKSRVIKQRKGNASSVTVHGTGMKGIGQRKMPARSAEPLLG